MSASSSGGVTTPGYRHRGLEELFRLARMTPLPIEQDQFVFLRHGETDGNFTKIFQTAEQQLNARGLEQARRAAECLAGHRLERIAASTMRRAWHTAEIVSMPHRLMPEPVDGLRERWFGDLVGTPSADYDWRNSPPNGEPLAVFVERTQRGLVEALKPAAFSALVAHGGTLYVLAASLGLELETADYANCTPLLVERSGRSWRVTRLAASTGSGDNIS
jgi:glucosyl-3-phosphoglycerate phosphatase